MSLYGYTPFSLSYNTLNRVSQGLGAAVGFQNLARSGKYSSATQYDLPTKKPTMSGLKRKPRVTKKAKYTKVATVAAVKKMIMGNMEMKQLTVGLSTGFMERGSFYSTNITAKVLQGTTDGTRIGDVINLKSLQINGVAIAGSAGQYYIFRVLIVYSGEEYNPATMTTGGLGYNEIMVPNAIALTGAMATTNSKSVQVVFDRTYEINSMLLDKIDGIPININVDLKNIKFPFQSGGSVYGKTKNLYVVVASYQHVAAADVDKMQCVANATIKYSDS